MSTFLKHLSELGTALKRANAAYNKSVSSMEARVLPSVRKFKELGATAEEDIAAIEPLEEIPRELNAPEATADPEQTDASDAEA